MTGRVTLQKPVITRDIGIRCKRWLFFGFFVSYMCFVALCTVFRVSGFFRVISHLKAVFAEIDCAARVLKGDNPSTLQSPFVTLPPFNQPPSIGARAAALAR